MRRLSPYPDPSPCRRRADWAVAGTMTGRAVLFLFVLLSLSGCNNSESTTGTGWKPGDMTDPSIQPKIIYSNPAANSAGPFALYNPGPGSALPHIILRFNKLMNTASVSSSSFSVTGFDQPVAVKLSAGQPSGLYSDLLLLTIVDANPAHSADPVPWFAGHQYSLSVDTSLTDINGNRARDIVPIAFTPEPAFRIIAVTPADNASDVPVSAAVNVLFNSPVPDDITGSFIISPAIHGQWVIDPRYRMSVTLLPSEQLGFSLNYSVALPATVRDTARHNLNRQLVSTFSTVNFAVKATQPLSEEKGVALNRPVSISFTGDIDTGSVRTAFSLTPATAGTFQFSSRWGFDFYPVAGLLPGTTYSVEINNSIRSLSDGASTEYRFQFTTDKFRMLFSDPAAGAYNVNRNAAFTVTFNAQLDTGSVRNSVSFGQLIPGTFVLYAGSDSFTFVPSSPLDALSQYTITITQGLKTQRGSNLPAPASITFTTGQ